MPTPAAGADPESREWLDGLRAAGARRDAAQARLHALLLRAARSEAGRRGAADVDDLAQQAADDATVSVLRRLDDFRGLSRFTTWAYRFAVYEVSGKLARRAARDGAVTLDDAAWERLPDRLAPAPDRVAEQHELLAALRRAVEHDLTAHQRRVFTAVALNDVGIDRLAAELDSNRNAVYKTLFDARRKLRASLAAAGHTLDAP